MVGESPCFWLVQACILSGKHVLKQMAGSDLGFSRLHMAEQPTRNSESGLLRACRTSFGACVKASSGGASASGRLCFHPVLAPNGTKVFCWFPFWFPSATKRVASPTELCTKLLPVFRKKSGFARKVANDGKCKKKNLLQ